MAHYVIGDVQGCYSELQALVKKIKFNPNKDKIIFAGDLINKDIYSLKKTFSLIHQPRHFTIYV
ncbi:metallophosphoesterase [Gammaproteobacteria bacterium]|nr:metallophosphoesterase [Gammaproteobacteria bacterium]